MLYDILKEYKEVTLKLTEEIQGEGFIEPLVAKREELIQRMKSIDFSKDEFRQICGELSIVPIEKEMYRIYEVEKVKLQNNLEEVRNRRKAALNYNSNSQSPVFFNKKI